MRRQNLRVADLFIFGWSLERLKDASADADILLDEFAYEIIRKKMLKGKKEKVRRFFSFSNPVVFHFKMANKIKNINLRMDEIFQKSTRIGVRPAEIMHFPTNDPRSVPLSAPFVDDSKIMPREDDVANMLTQLTAGNSNDLSVIGVVGMPGLGKTSVAQLLMKIDIVQKLFEKRI